MRTSSVILAALAAAIAVGWAAVAPALAETAPPEATPGIQVDSERIVIQENPRGFANVTLMIVDVLTVTNRGGQDQPQVIIPLAPGHMGLMFQSGASADQVVIEEKRFIDRQGLKAGESRQYTFMYGLGFPGLPNLINRAVLYPTRQLSVVVPAGEFEAEAPGLASAGTKEMAQQVQIYANTAPLAPSADFAITVKRAKRGISPWFWAWLALFLMPVVGIIAIRVRLQRARNQAASRPAAGRQPEGRQGRGRAPVKR